MLFDKNFSRKLNEYKDVCHLMRTAFPQNEQIPMWLLRVLAFRKSVNFRVFYDDDRIRSKGYGTKILDWLKQNTEKIIVLNVEAINSSAKSALQREKRISFYNRNGIFGTGCKFIDEGETYSVRTSDIEHFDSKEYAMLLVHRQEDEIETI